MSNLLTKNNHLQGQAKEHKRRKKLLAHKGAKLREC